MTQWADIEVSADSVTALRIRHDAIDVTWRETREVRCDIADCDLPHETETVQVTASITPDAQFYRDLSDLFARLAGDR